MLNSNELSNQLEPIEKLESRLSTLMLSYSYHVSSLGDILQESTKINFAENL